MMRQTGVLCGSNGSGPVRGFRLTNFSSNLCIPNKEASSGREQLIVTTYQNLLIMLVSSYAPFNTNSMI